MTKGRWFTAYNYQQCGDVGRLLHENCRKCGDVVAQLHRYYRDGVLDVFVGERDLHDDDFGHECYQRVVVYGDSFGGINTILTMLCAWGF